MESLAILLTQLFIPLSLLGLYALHPAGSRAELVLWATGVVLLVVVATRLFLWAFLPWWLPWTYVLAAVGIIVWHLQTLPLSSLPVLRTGPLAWVNCACALLLVLTGLWGVAQVVAARTPPAAEVVDIRSPLGPGRYLVGHGGSTALLNHHIGTLDPSAERFADWRGQSFAYDVVGINRFGTHADGWRPRDPSRYEIFGAPLYAPCDGVVLQSENGMPDLTVPEMDQDRPLGNHVLLQCGGDVVLVMAHLQQGSVQAGTGDRVAAGDLLARVGNSGNSSEPHLHIHAQRPGTSASPISGEPLLLTIDGRYLLRNMRLTGHQW